ncbi:hypothetical protein HSR122_1614 [Halapricum desulfuricans]|uniref:Uncharacterized protein n=2 Tax=Halapricum desulfuricans TaxID=2841257 RepID=A0A897NC42_9EURY|nr:hypothetical protein HSR122_1614 [Halapricum desulfuricans]
MMTDTDIQAIEFEQTDRAMGVYIEGIGVYGNGSREVLDSTTVGSPREFDRIRAFESRCKRQYGL